MKVLVVSCSPWREDNSIGNSYTNIFKGIEDIEIAHICCGSGVPDTNFVDKHFHINEKKIIKNLFNKEYKTGEELKGRHTKNELVDTGRQNGIFDFMKIYRLQIFFWIRDFIWCFKNWISPELKDFVNGFQPDIIFSPFLDSTYLNEMLFFLKKYTNKPLIVYAWDDVYTLKQFSLSPFYWVNRLNQRRKLKKINDISSIMYTISPLQQKEYSRIFDKDCKILCKSYVFEEKFDQEKKKINTPVQMVFTGNIAMGRWKTLSKIGKALEIINKNGIKAQLVIYTTSPLNKRMKEELNIKNSILLKGSIPSSEVMKIQQEADVLVHVESFELKERLKVRMSFSTKLVDYFRNKKCIFAVGNRELASIEYLIKNDAAIVAVNEAEILKQLSKMVEEKECINKYSKKSWECGKRNHEAKKIKNSLYIDLKKVVNINK